MFDGFLRFVVGFPIDLFNCKGKTKENSGATVDCIYGWKEYIRVEGNECQCIAVETGTEKSSI